METKITMDREYQTRDGREVRILCVDRKAKGLQPVIALVMDGDSELQKVYQPDGRHYGDCESHDLDLVPKPKRITGTVWLNRYGNRAIQALFNYSSREEADRASAVDRTECFAIEFDIPEGEGLPSPVERREGA